MNSGSEANDLATLMAREYTGNYEVIGNYFFFVCLFKAMRNGYHGGAGNGLGLTSLHTWKFKTPVLFSPQTKSSIFREILELSTQKIPIYLEEDSKPMTLMQ